MENNSDLNDDDIKDFTYTLCDYYVLKFPLEMMNENYEKMLIDEIFDNLIICIFLFKRKIFIKM